MANFTIAVGPSRTFATLQLAWNSLPSSIPSGDTYTITMQAGLYTGALNCAASVKTIAGLVVIQPEAGAAWWELYPALNHPLTYDNTVGVVIEGTAGTVEQFVVAPFVKFQGLQIKCTVSTQPVFNIQSGSQLNFSRCIVVGSDYFFNQPGNAFGGDFYNNVFLVNSTTKSPFNFSDLRASNFAGNVIYAVNGNSAPWLAATVNNGTALCKDNVIIGFGSAPSTYMNSSSSNNATDLGSLFGTSNIVGTTAAAQFVSATPGALDLRPKSGATIIGAGVTSSFIPVDAYNVTRPASPTIGAAEPVVAGTSVSSDLAATYAITAYVSSDLGATYSVGSASTPVSSDLSATFNIFAFVSKDLAASYYVGTPPGTFVTEPWFNNTLWAPRSAQAVSYTWVGLGRVGSLAGKTLTEGTGTLSTSGTLTVSGLPAGAGFLLGAVLGTDAVTDKPYYQAGTVT